jgi:hypothetical protein
MGHRMRWSDIIASIRHQNKPVRSTGAPRERVEARHWCGVFVTIRTGCAGIAEGCAACYLIALQSHRAVFMAAQHCLFIIPHML